MHRLLLVYSFLQVLSSREMIAMLHGGIGGQNEQTPKKCGGQMDAETDQEDL